MEKLWGRSAREGKLWSYKGFSWLNKFGETRMIKQREFSSVLLNLKIAAFSVTAPPFIRAGKSPKSWKLSWLVKPHRGHLTAPEGNENFSVDPASVFHPQICLLYLGSRAMRTRFQPRNAFESCCPCLHYSWLASRMSLRILEFWGGHLRYLPVSGACPAVLDAPSAGWSRKLDHIWTQDPTR